MTTDKRYEKDENGNQIRFNSRGEAIVIRPNDSGQAHAHVGFDEKGNSTWFAEKGADGKHTYGNRMAEKFATNLGVTVATNADFSEKTDS